MVLQKRLDYGFTGYQVPAIPRASRSARGKGFIKKKLEDFVKKKVEDHPMCAFELLATVAGELQERENFTPSDVTHGRTEVVIAKNVIKHEQQDKEITLKVEPCDHGSCDEWVFASDVGSQRPSPNDTSKEYANAQNDVAFGPSSIVTKSNRPEKFSYAKKSPIGRSNNGFENYLGTIHRIFSAERGSPGYAESHEGKIEDGIERHTEVEQHRIGSMINGSVPDMCSSEDPMDTKPPALVSSDSSVEVSLCQNDVPCSSFPKCGDDLKLVSRDDDENSSGCTQPSTLTLNGYRPPRHGDRRKRKLLASKFWKAAPRSFKDGELSNTDVGVKPVFHNRKMCFTRQRTQRFYSFKRRKLFDLSSVSTSDGGISSEGVSNSPEKATGTSSSSAGQKSFFKSEDAHVKLSIKSFRVPELFIEIPETATVGSLKKTVMEAVTAILGGGLRVGVLLQGKKVRDDNKTLQQTGISHSDKLDSIGFTLEPNPTHTPSPPFPEDPHFLPLYDATQPLHRGPAVPASGPAASNASIDPPLTTTGNFVESDHDSVPSITDLSLEKMEPNSRALVAIPAMSLEALAVVPLHRKSRGSELVQRRIRRPFSVSEVEALVQAVEKLGTGRWRDVKLRAFDNAKHRTYVDLKDKWKTLVHTARISPQQRRGEPVPQELLDRVLSAHAYWSQQQAQQQIKQHSDSCLLL